MRSCNGSPKNGSKYEVVDGELRVGATSRWSPSCPDVSFVAIGRLLQEAGTAAFPQLAPDLVVEVLSPADSPRAVLDSVGEYLESGVRLVWVIDPDKRRAVVYRSLSKAREIAASGILDGEDVLPGLSCPLADLFE